MVSPKPLHYPKQVQRQALVKQADWEGVVENAKLQADFHDRKAGIKRRYYERQLGLLKVRTEAQTLIQTLTLTLTLTLTVTWVCLGRDRYTPAEPGRGTR
jgi:hypothetical protein